MSQTHFDGPLASGPRQAGAPPGPNVGLAVLSQQVVMNANAALAVTADVYLPAGSQIIDIIPDVLVAFNGTAAPLTVGTPGAPPAYVTTVDAKVVGRAAPVFSAGQLLAMADIGANTTVRLTVTPTGANTVGTVRTTILYIQKQ